MVDERRRSALLEHEVAIVQRAPGSDRSIVLGHPREDLLGPHARVHGRLRSRADAGHAIPRERLFGACTQMRLPPPVGREHDPAASFLNDLPDQRELVRLELAMVVAADDSVQVEEEQLHALLCERGGRGSCAGRHLQKRRNELLPYKKSSVGGAGTQTGLECPF